jgi:hypothetical protein
MGSNTLIRTYFLEEPIVHPILSHKVKLIILFANLKERSQPAEVEFVVGRGMLKKIASSSRGQWTPRNDGK